MSTYTIGEILAWLVLAGLLGFVLGWLVRELQLRAKRQAQVASPAPEQRPEPEPEPELEPEPEPEPEPDPEPQPEPEPSIKGKTSSMIYHSPDSPAYARTKADVWFRTPEEAEAAGFRKPKNA